MTAVEALPGGGWHSKILLPYLGSEGELVAAFYPKVLWAMFGFFPEDVVKQREQELILWPEKAEAWRDEGDAEISDASFELNALPESADETADAVLFIRALHNLRRFEDKVDFITPAIESAFNVLKPSGILSVVQHRAPEQLSDEWASGPAGYLKQSFIIAKFEAAGFSLVETSEINANPNDKPTEEDIVWRLPPSLNSSKEDPEAKAAMLAIGESDRMTLKFMKQEASQ